MGTYTLTELQYSQDRKGPFRLYIYEMDGYYHRAIDVPEEISKVEMMYQAIEAMAVGREVRITDSGDMLVYHAKNKEVLYPSPVGNFWKDITKD